MSFFLNPRILSLSHNFTIYNRLRPRNAKNLTYPCQEKKCLSVLSFRGEIPARTICIAKRQIRVITDHTRGVSIAKYFYIL